MDFKRCIKGHIYDSTQNDKCPYCKKVIKDQIELEDNIQEEKTRVSLSYKVEPVVGWLVCIEGAEKGKDYRLVDKRNFVGRSEQMDVCILGDENINKQNHFSITYESNKRIFVISPGNNGDIIYVNKKAIYETNILENYSLIELANTKLVFITLCGSNFTWSKNG